MLGCLHCRFGDCLYFAACDAGLPLLLVVVAVLIVWVFALLDLRVIDLGCGQICFVVC